jgi:hypothetical protein
VLWRGVLARVLARRGERKEAEECVRAAEALVAETDFLELRASTLLAMSEVVGGAPGARLAEDALRLYEAKGNVVAADAVAARLAAGLAAGPLVE